MDDVQVADAPCSVGPAEGEAVVPGLDGLDGALGAEGADGCGSPEIVEVSYAASGLVLDSLIS